MSIRSSHPKFQNYTTALLCMSALIGTTYGSPAFAADKVRDEQGFYASGRLLVKGKPGLTNTRLAEILSKHAAKSGRKINGANVDIVNVPPGLEKKILSELKSDKSIDFVELDRAIEPSFVPDDPSYSSQWHHAKINSAGAWDVANANNVVIAILDGGTDATHPDLASAMLQGWNTVSNTTDTTDITGHGTKTAGTAAAVVNNTVGVAGLATGAKIMPVRITNDATGYAYWSDIANGVTWAADHGAKVVSNSYASYVSTTVTSAATYLKSKGGIMIASAGNDGAACAVGADPSIVVVSATDSNDAKASWSNYGDCIDVAAPGVGIWTTTAGGGYGAPSGTSFAAPLTAGLAALIYGANSALSANDVESILETTTYKPDGQNFSASYGYGRIDAAAAVTKAKTFQPTVLDTTAPKVSISSPTAGAQVKGLVSVDVAASDNIGVAKVDLLVNGVTFATDMVAPFSFAWDTTPLGNATPTLVAIAYDAAGNKTTSTAVKVNVGNVADIVAPTINITSPTNGVTLSSNTTIRATAKDDMAVASMAISIDGKQVATATSGSISYSWNVKKAGSGSHTITVKATDPSMNSSQSSVTVNVK